MNTKGKQVLRVKADNKKKGYFVTSIPYDKGMKGYIDGKEVKVEIVNKAFCGFVLGKGQHEVVLSYVAQGKKLGVIMSIAGLFGVVVVAWLEGFKKRVKNDEEN